MTESVSSYLRFIFTRPLLKTDEICKKCGGYVSLKFNPGDKPENAWVTKKCKCGMFIKYLQSGKEVYKAKSEYDPKYKEFVEDKKDV
jgi:hypothetical protein